MACKPRETNCCGGVPNRIQIAFCPNGSIGDPVTVAAGTFFEATQEEADARALASAEEQLFCCDDSGFISCDLVLADTKLDSGIVGFNYSTQLNATGGTLPYHWAVVSGSLPPGLSLNPNTGEISGTPTFAGTYTFAVQVID